MASRALTGWCTDSAGKLDELIAAHASVVHAGRGRQYATAQINASLVVQVAAHFQLFCRNLHTEAVESLAEAAPDGYRTMLRVAFTEHRGLDRRNASVQTIGEDFGRFDLSLWKKADAMSSRTATRRIRLEQLMAWRNAVVHQDFAFSPQQSALLAGTSLTLAWVGRWRSACDGLTWTLDRAVCAHIRTATGTAPW